MTGLAHRGHALNDYGHHIIHALHGVGYTSALAGMQHIAKPPAATVKSIGYGRILTEDAAFEPATAAAIDFLHEPHNQPFFLSVGYFAPHRASVAHREEQSFPSLGPSLDARYVRPPSPLPDTPTTRRDFAEYAASMQSVDLCMGRVLEAIDRAGLADDTLVIATTDHGIAFPGMKCQLVDHGTGVMLIIRGPAAGAFRGGNVIDAAVTQLDLYPTLCELAGAAIPADLDGKSLLPLVRGEVDALHDVTFGEVNYHAAYEPLRSARTARWKYIRRFDDYVSPILPNIDESPSKSMYLRHDYATRQLPREALYDLLYDPSEANNLVGSVDYADALNGMRRHLDRFMRETDDPLLKGPVPLPPNGWAVSQDAATPDG